MWSASTTGHTAHRSTDGITEISPHLLVPPASGRKRLAVLPYVGVAAELRVLVVSSRSGGSPRVAVNGETVLFGHGGEGALCEAHGGHWCLGRGRVGAIAAERDPGKTATADPGE